MKRSILAGIVFGILLFAGCAKNEYVQKNGIVRYTGPFADGGCDYIIQFPLIAFQPQNLPSEFRGDSIPISINYRRLNDAPICTSSDIEGTIYIHKITEIVE